MNNYYNPPLTSRSGTYSGNDAQNRGIAHNLGRIPSQVMIFHQSNATIYQINGAQPTSLWNHNDGAITAVTQLDAVYFYVGDVGHTADGANETGINYTWVAL